MVMQYRPPLGPAQTLPRPQWQPARLDAAEADLLDASGQGLAMEGRSGAEGAAAVPVSEEALESVFFDAQRLKAESGAQPNSLTD